MATEFLDKTGLTYLWGKLKSQFAPKVHDHKADEILPIASKTYTGVIASANTFANGTFYFGTVMPTSFYGTWGLRYRVEVWAAGESQSHALADLYLFGTKDVLQATSSWNIIENTTYYPAYNNSVYRAKEVGINAGYGHALGVRIYSSWNPTTAANARTIKVDILECINCSFSFYANDAIYKYSQIPGTGSTNYSGNTDINFTAQGLQETGDANSTEPSNVKYYNTLLAKSAIVANTIVVGDSSGYQGIASGVTFDINYPILWCTTAIAASGTNYNNIYTQVCDRTLTNIGTFSFAARKMVYLIVTISGLTATVDSALLTDTLPNTEDGKVYIAMGRMGNQTTGANYFFYQTEHPMFQYKNGSLREYTLDFYQKPSGGIPSSDMASAVQTSLGKADSAYQKPSGGIPKTDLASAVQTSLGKADTAYQKPSGGIPKTDLASAVQTSLGKADSAYQKPSTGIPSTDLAESYYLASNPSGYTSNAGTITGVSANGTSVATSGVANIPAASTSAYGVTKLSDSTSTTSSVLAATPTAVKAAYDLANGKYSKPSGGIPKTDLASAVQTSLGKADSAYQKPSGGIPSTDMASAVTTSLGKADTAYQKPSGGIPSTDLAESYYLASNPSGYTSNAGTITGVSANGTSVATSGVANIPAASTSAYGVTKLSDSTSTTSSVLAATPTAVKAAYDLANGKYSKPSGGIPKTDLASAVQTSLGKADTAYQKPSGGIPSTDLADTYAKAPVRITISSVSNLPVTVTGKTEITADMVVQECVLSNPMAQTGDWTVTTTNGGLTISGTISGTTDITLILSEVVEVS